MGVIQKILALNCLHPEKGGSTDMTVDQLVIGALEEAFMEMVKYPISFQLLTLATFLANSADDKLMIFFFFIFPRKQGLTFHANGLHWRPFA